MTNEKITIKPNRAPEDVWRILGLAVRAGQVVSGADGVSHSIRRKKAKLVMVAGDAAENTVEKVTRFCRMGDVPFRRFGTASEIGHWTGHPIRAAAAVLDQGFADRISSLIDSLDETGKAIAANE